MTDPTLALTKTLIAAPSVTPNDAGCQKILAARLEKLGFTIEWFNFDDQHGSVTNLWARKGSTRPCLAFAGHTDVVPIGDIRHWHSDPFEATEREGYLYGRGAADMKTSLAAFITSIEQFVINNPDHKGSLALLITSDEEGPATCGTRKVIDALESRNEKIDYCVVGEPSSTSTLGDVIKNGRRGSLGGVLRISGIQGHVAYPQLADNPIHKLGAVISALTKIVWDQGNAHFPASSFQISNIGGGTGATNVIPESASVTFNLRFSTEQTPKRIKQRIIDELDQLELDYKIGWTLFGLPFLTEAGALVEACSAAITAETGVTPELSTSGGTSDGRFIAPTGAEVVELGPVNASIHKVNERVCLRSPATLSKIYHRIMQSLLD